MLSIGTLFLSKRSKTTPKGAAKSEAPRYAPKVCTYSVFNISVTIPGDWTVRPDHHGRDFCFEYGYYRFEKTYEKSDDKAADSISFGLRWETTEKETGNEIFISEYARHMEEQYGKKMKKISDFKYDGSEIIELSGGIRACLMRISYRASNKLFGKGGPRIAVTNAAFLHEPTRRRIIGAVIAVADRMQAQREQLEALLYSIKAV